MAKQVLRDGVWVDDTSAASERNQQETAARRVDISHGRIRRDGTGTRPMSSFFAPEHRLKTMTREDYVNNRASEEYSRREQVWYRKLWRWLMHRPRVMDINAAVAGAHGRNLHLLEVALLEQREAERKAARAITRDDAADGNQA